MTDRRLSTIDAVVRSHLCTGCGACAFLAPDSLDMVDLPEVGLRPVPRPGAAPVAGAALEACPGRTLGHDPGTLADAPFGGAWGRVLALYECWSTDEELRFRGSSGGVVSGLAAHALESGSAVGVLQVRASRTDPLRNETVLSRTREDVLAAGGSRYAPASPCSRLDLVEGAEGPCVVVGKPCDIAAVDRMSRTRPDLAAKLAFTIGIFCAGTPTTRATEKVIESLGVEPGSVTSLDYRGNGWPGEFRVSTEDGTTASTSYAASWGALTRDRQWRCLICPDHTGEFADLSVGDPWYRKPTGEEPGRSLVVVRTERGRAALDAALRDGALAGHPLPLTRLPESQPSLEGTRGAVWGRVQTMRVMGLPVPRYRNLPSVRLWLRLPWRGKVTSTAGTWRRARERDLNRPEAGSRPAADRREVRG